MKTFGCLKYKIDQAKKFNSLNTCIKLPQTSRKTRVHMEIGKIEHFLDFVFFSGILQDVAYGTTKVEFQSGEEQHIGNAVNNFKVQSHYCFLQTILLILKSIYHFLIVAEVLGRA